MKLLRKRKLLKELNYLLESVDNIELHHIIDPTNVKSSDGFNTWFEETTHTLSQVFGSTSEQKQRFEKLEFGYGMFLEALIQSKAILKGSIYRIEKYGLPGQSSNTQTLNEDISDSANRKPPNKSKFFSSFGGIVLQIILPIISFIIGGYWSDYRES